MGTIKTIPGCDDVVGFVVKMLVEVGVVLELK